jgi:hypothetical protein
MASNGHKSSGIKRTNETRNTTRIQKKRVFEKKQGKIELFS